MGVEERVKDIFPGQIKGKRAGVDGNLFYKDVY